MKEREGGVHMEEKVWDGYEVEKARGGRDGGDAEAKMEVK